MLWITYALLYFQSWDGFVTTSIYSSNKTKTVFSVTDENQRKWESGKKLGDKNKITNRFNQYCSHIVFFICSISSFLFYFLFSFFSPSNQKTSFKIIRNTDIYLVTLTRTYFWYIIFLMFWFRTSIRYDRNQFLEWHTGNTFVQVEKT